MERVYIMNDSKDYRDFTKPAEIHKAVNTLHGIVAGIKADQSVGSSEIAELTHWCQLHGNLRSRHPFSELLPVIEAACEDGILTDEESQDIIWLCEQITSDHAYYDLVTSSIQYLSGLVHGLMADGVLQDEEIKALKTWVDDHETLSGSYPFDEIHRLLSDILFDGKITQEEREELMAFFGNIIEFKDSQNLVEADFKELQKKYSVDGICAVFPEIQFEGKIFCFTGDSYRATRAEMTAIVEHLGGIVRSSVSKKTDYLIVGTAGNECWKYACYGRKIETAMNLRKSGAHVCIINEIDFWDAVEDADAGITD